MRLWSLHPSLLDDEGLHILWQDGLAAQGWLTGRRQASDSPHPQLARFRACESPVSAISLYLRGICAEGQKRGHAFDARAIRPRKMDLALYVTRGQVEYEVDRLAAQLADRDMERMHQMLSMTGYRLHPLFRLTEGAVEAWEEP